MPRTSLQTCLSALVLLTGVACTPPSVTGDADAGIPSTLVNAADVPIDGISEADLETFREGDTTFGVAFREVDGLGPLYVRTACASCHREGARGPGLVEKMSVVAADDVTPLSDQSPLPFGHTIRLGLAAGAVTPIDIPADAGVTVKVSNRLGPPNLGRGYLEAVTDAEIERMEQEQSSRSDGIHGHANRVTYTSEADATSTFEPFAPGQTNIIGRFGVKARIATLSDFTADAFQGDMGLTTPLRPRELLNPDGLLDDARPGVDLDLDHVHRVTAYLRNIAIPRRVELPETGPALFKSAHCDVCHAPSLKTRSDYPVPMIAGKPAPVFTDLLLHDMGDALADGQTDGIASSREFRTAPLIGLRFSTLFLHDGRAHSVDEAIRAHDGEAADAEARYLALSSAERATLLDYVQKL